MYGILQKPYLCKLGTGLCPNTIQILHIDIPGQQLDKIHAITAQVRHQTRQVAVILGHHAARVVYFDTLHGRGVQGIVVLVVRYAVVDAHFNALGVRDFSVDFEEIQVLGVRDVLRGEFIDVHVNAEIHHAENVFLAGIQRRVEFDFARHVVAQALVDRQMAPADVHLVRRSGILVEQFKNAFVRLEVVNGYPVTHIHAVPAHTLRRWVNGVRAADTRADIELEIILVLRDGGEVFNRNVTGLAQG